MHRDTLASTLDMHSLWDIMHLDAIRVKYEIYPVTDTGSLFDLFQIWSEWHYKFMSFENQGSGKLLGSHIGELKT